MALSFIVKSTKLNPLGCNAGKPITQQLLLDEVEYMHMKNYPD
jgi:hypothetical protein